ncbi:type III-B CRISPR module RAMP protein Cmr4 [Caldivirga sp.]|uniref:type III-B CRISPR module RAMP protein Cmr4 n=1 Tax=Caldivirga sp. TaxID=2080243 RepID=UPI003D0F6A6D
MNQQQEVRGLFFIEALTPMHPGLGKGGEGFVDLPVQRDEFGFPTIWASSLKGAIKSSLLLSCNNKVNDVDKAVCRREILLIFGPETEEASEYASAVSILDARLVLIPARSLKGIWTYVTSPHLLNYLATYLEIVDDKQRLRALGEVLNLVKGKNAVTSRKETLVSSGGQNYVVLNEQELIAEYSDAIARLSELFPKEVAELIKERGITIISDELASGIVRKSLIIQPRIRLDYASKTVVGSGLWEEEYLPQFTVMASVVICRKVRLTDLPSDKLREKINKIADNDSKRYSNVNKDDLSKRYSELVNNELAKVNNICSKIRSLNSMMFGGKETVGKGLARLMWV